MIPRNFTPRHLKRYRAAFLMALPALIGLLIFNYWPIAEAVRTSFNEYNKYTGEFLWLGDEHYRTALEDPLLLDTLAISFKYFVLSVPAKTLIALGLALLVNRAIKGIGILRTIILLPTVTSMVVASLIWGFMYNAESGLINSVLETVGLERQLFFVSATQALPSVIVVSVWKSVGLMMLFFLAGLIGIPEEYYDAAKVDGANRWQQFRYVTLPMLRNTTIFVIITSTISAFKIFVPIQLLTKGGPQGTTRVIVLYIYRLAFQYNRLGYAMAVSVMFALLLIAISLFQSWLAREK